MVFPWVAGAVIGAWVVGRSKPNTRVQKKHILGPSTGLTHEVDEFTDAGIVAVRNRELQVCVTFIRTPDGYKFLRGSGPPALVQRVIADLCRESPNPWQP